ncbi:tyrosine-type recombinase/integrase [Mesorhizobium sp. RSR565B]|uniref:tyrosine-type recombinase/integrase n=1 Tax=unclassified Mesorhizobium TaxID=325217 RepID=UPI0003CF29C0|nr:MULTISPECIES: integrase arm-type DNA-binding domain-containing protein [unclassified Mesorhizobium]ESY07325.1 integrase [Mesorhizobium sp. LNJC399B00]WJI70633.1 integrase arm-type DNA-binding domain-containing protein [Mesorhizobium sp. C399B]
MPLSDAACRNAKAGDKPRKLSDGGGLFLLVQPTGGKLWRLAYRFQLKQKTLAFGAFPAVGLKDARFLRQGAKELLAKGLDPSEQKKIAKREAQLEASNTLGMVAEEWFDARKHAWTPGYSDRIWRRLQSDVLSVMGNRPINGIEPPELLDVIRAIERRGAVVLAKRILQVTGQVFRYAIASGRASRDPSQDLRGALRSPGSTKHRAALKAGELPEFLRSLEQYQGDRTTTLALKLIVHTFLRTAEVRFGQWQELEGLDGDSPLWRIPASRMKTRNEHLIPLTPQVTAILRELKHLAGTNRQMLPAPTKDGVISQNTLIYALYRMGYHSRATVHGFRGTASTVLNEHGFNRDWIERQLAHTERSDVRAAYNTAEWLADRQKMLIWWSNYLDDARAKRLANAS